MTTATLTETYTLRYRSVQKAEYNLMSKGPIVGLVGPQTRLPKGSIVRPYTLQDVAALLLRIDDALQLCAYVDLVSGRGFHTEAYTSPELREVRQNSPLDIVLSLAGGASIVGGALYMGAVRFIKLRSRWIELKRQESEADSEQRIRLAETDLKLLQLQRVTMDMVRSEQDRGRLMQRADGQWAGLATVLWTSESISLTGPDGEVIASSEGQ